MEDQVLDRRDFAHFDIHREFIDRFARKVGVYGVAVYCCLARFAGQNPTCWPAKKTLAEMLDCSETTITKALATLEEHRLITIEQRTRPNGTSQSNVYTLLAMPKMTTELQVLEGTDPDLFTLVHPPRRDPSTPQQTGGTPHDVTPYPPRRDPSTPQQTGGTPHDVGGKILHKKILQLEDTTEKELQEKRRGAKKTAPTPTTIQRKPFPAEEPSISNPIAHLLWRIEMIDGCRLPDSQAGRAAKTARELLTIATEEEIVAAYVMRREERGVEYEFRYLVADMSKVLRRVRDPRQTTALGRRLVEEEAAVNAYLARRQEMR